MGGRSDAEQLGLGGRELLVVADSGRGGGDRSLDQVEVGEAGEAVDPAVDALRGRDPVGVAEQVAARNRISSGGITPDPTGRQNACSA